MGEAPIILPVLSGCQKSWDWRDYIDSERRRQGFGSGVAWRNTFTGISWWRAKLRILVSKLGKWCRRAKVQHFFWDMQYGVERILTKVSPDCAGWDRRGIVGYSLQLIVYCLQIFVVICWWVADFFRFSWWFREKSVLLRLDINKMNYYGTGSNNESSSIANPRYAVIY